MKRSIVWFRTNLRIDDNRPLLEAISQSDEVIPVFVLDETMFLTTNYESKKMGTFRLKFLIECLDELNHALTERGSQLLVLRGNSTEEILKLVKKYRIQSVYAEFPVAYEERKQQEELEKELWKEKSLLKTFLTNYLLDEKELPFPASKVPDVFSNFRKKVEKECLINSYDLAPAKISSPKFLPDYKLPELEELNRLEISSQTAFPFKGGLVSGKKRLTNYLYETKLIEHYKKTRNELIGSDYSTKLSPYLSFGCLSPREIYQEVKAYEASICKNESTYWVIFELWWREYFYWVMRKYDSKLFRINGIKEKSPVDRIVNIPLLNRWKQGKTGNDFIDANMNELNATGFMSNRGRQNVASYLVNDLQIDWRYGAAYFEEMLIDYDVCSNWGNWAYIAGVGNDPRGHRFFNVAKQAETYDNEYTYRKLWL